MATNWLVVELAEGADEGVAKLVPSDEKAQEHIAARINAGVSPQRLKLFAAADTPFGVSYQVAIGTDGPKGARPDAYPAEKAASDAPAAAPASAPWDAARRAADLGTTPAPAPRDGPPAEKEPVPAAESGAAKEAAPGEKEPAGTPEGVRMSSPYRQA